MNTRTLENEALALPVQERAKLIERLLDSLDSLPAQEAEVLWLDVAQRRAREIDEGKVQLLTPDELERRVQARLK
jgi:putative addiction module component (TIGR02574 family)